MNESRTQRSCVWGCWVDGECLVHTTAIAEKINSVAIAAVVFDSKKSVAHECKGVLRKTNVLKLPKSNSAHTLQLTVVLTPLH